jgi:hypothetical protein
MSTEQARQPPSISAVLRPQQDRLCPVRGLAVGSKGMAAAAADPDVGVGPDGAEGLRHAPIDRLCPRVYTDGRDLIAQGDARAALVVAANRTWLDHGLTGTNSDQSGRAWSGGLLKRRHCVLIKLDRLARLSDATVGAGVHLAAIGLCEQFPPS